ncbi:MAG: hypothetical protein ABUL73_04665 [Alphaproteobacteria bacterium]
MRAISALACVTALASCSAPADTAAVQRAVHEFHDKQTASDDRALYDAAAPAFRQAASFDDFVRLENAARAAIANGCPPAPETYSSWNVNYGTGGNSVSLTYQRQCAHGDLVENFTYALEKSGPLLAGYQVSGMALFPTAPSKDAAPAPSTPEKPAPATHATAGGTPT